MHRLTGDAASIASRCRRVRTGLAAGFGTPEAAETFKAVRGGLWMASETPGDLPFDDAQFEVAVLAGPAVCRETVREINRVLKPDGCLFFTVPERNGRQAGYTAPEIYGTVREGFDIVELRRPRWWHFARSGRTFSVVARKKAWREHKAFIREGSLPFTPFRERK